MNQLKNILILIGALIIAYLAGRYTARCPECVDGVTQVIKRDTVYIPRTYTATWTPKPTVTHPTQGRATRIEYTAPQDGTDTNTPLSGGTITPTAPDIDTSLTDIVIADSIRLDRDVGLSFRHVLRGGTIIRSDYSVRCPEIRITERVETTRTVSRKNALAVGGMAGVSVYDPAHIQVDIAPIVSYRYQKLQIIGGYGLLRNTILIGALREL